MKKITVVILLSFATIYANAQLKLSEKDFNNLVALSELYSHNNMCTGEEFAKTANSLRTPILDHMVDVLIATGKADTSLLNKRFLSRPGQDELVCWYILREIHYNRVDTTKKPLPSAEVAKKVLGDNIDERWLLDNYYYRLYSGLAMLFNNADLSAYNIDMSNLGLKDETEKAIFFLNMINELIGGRFQVLNYMKKNERIMEFSRKIPQFNGKAYFYYTNFDFADFDWIGYDKKESYKQKNVGSFINTLLMQLNATANTGDKSGGRDLYYNSILRKPEYFEYSPLKGTLKKLYDSSK